MNKDFFYQQIYTYHLETSKKNQWSLYWETLDVKGWLFMQVVNSDKCNIAENLQLLFQFLQLYWRNFWSSTT